MQQTHRISFSTFFIQRFFSIPCSRIQITFCFIKLNNPAVNIPQIYFRPSLFADDHTSIAWEIAEVSAFRSDTRLSIYSFSIALLIIFSRMFSAKIPALPRGISLRILKSILRNFSFFRASKTFSIKIKFREG